MGASMRTVRTDVLLALILLALAFATQISLAEIAPGPLDYLLLVLVAAPVAVRQFAPVATFLTMGCAAGMYLLVGNLTQADNWLGAVLGMFTVASLRRLRTAAVLYFAGVAVVLASGLATAEKTSWAEAALACVTLLIALMLGVSVKRKGEYTEYLAKEAVQAVARERVRIAREIHDIVAHHMSVVALQAGLAGRVIDTDRSSTRTAISTIADSSRAALSELRRLLDILRVDDPSGADSEDRREMGLASLHELVEHTRRAGLPVDLLIEGTPRELPAGQDLCAYRVVQESLTNVLKHVERATATVELEYDTDTLFLTVTNDGRTHARTTPGSHGIRGMRERAALYDGVLTAGPVESGGFQVVLCMPITGDGS
ncbi:histidine kinase [Amycolatopsis minnesotensis]|uniref:histidine kinase n=1 Tax=Amycolatopsis minnesotensis TaxID=337894 RepID=A0ABN2RLE3_9PSEU